MGHDQSGAHLEESLTIAFAQFVQDDASSRVGQCSVDVGHDEQASNTAE
jgi:hypothetical protein